MMIKNFRFVIDKLLAGSSYPKTAEEIEELYYDYDIRAIVSFEPIDDLKAVIERIKSLNIIHLNIFFGDGEEPTLKQAEEFISFVDKCLKEQKPVLCHCLAGRGRTGTMLIAYLITKCGYSLGKAQDAVLNTVESDYQLEFLNQYNEYLKTK